ncbi:MAG: NusG domain II-containing protein [Treponema sp.]|jgi:hypothetical protein|nr:NusG domain II-containing protein [Treponema sp.]
MRITIPDTVVIILALGIVIYSAALVYGSEDGVPQVVLESGGRRWEYPLNAVETIAVPGPLGDTIIELRGNEARIAASPCTGQNCIAAGAIHRHGQWIACLPNQVMVSVQAAPGKGPELDAAAW